jgi:hypothetical protein
VAADEEIKLKSQGTDLMIRDPHYYVKRNPFAILANILLFVLRLGASLLTRSTRAIARSRLV